VGNLDVFLLPATNLMMKKESSELPKPTRRACASLVLPMGATIRNHGMATTVDGGGAAKKKRMTSVAL
jgi:hypothetical protein